MLATMAYFLVIPQSETCAGALQQVPVRTRRVSLLVCRLQFAMPYQGHYWVWSSLACHCFQCVPSCMVPGVHNCRAVACSCSGYAAAALQAPVAIALPSWSALLWLGQR